MKIRFLALLLFLFSISENNAQQRFRVIKTLRKDHLSETRAVLHSMGNVYNPIPQSDKEPIDADSVLNEYWRSLQNKTQNQKDAAFGMILKLNFTDEGYPEQRKHFAAAAYIKANLNRARFEGGPSLLHEIAEKQDYDLCKLLLEHGAQPDFNPSNSEWLSAPLLRVRSAQLGQLFINAGANPWHYSDNCETILHWAVYDSCEPGLLALYLRQDIDLMHKDIYECTFLATLVRNAWLHSLEDLHKKIELIVRALEPCQLSTLLTMEVRTLAGGQETPGQFLARRHDAKSVWLANYFNTLSGKQKIS